MSEGVTGRTVDDEDFDDPELIQTPAMIEARLVLFGKEAASIAECLTQEETAEYITGFLRTVIAQLTGIEPPPPPRFEFPREVN